MVKNLDLKIQMILESRVCLEDASIIFGISKEEFATLIDGIMLSRTDSEALRYLFYYEATYYKEQDKQKTRWIAKVWFNKYINLCRIEDKRKQLQALRKFKYALIDAKVVALEGKHFSDLTPEEKELILRYQLKYGINNTDMAKMFNSYHTILAEWYRKNIKDEKLLKRFELLVEYYSNIRKQKLDRICNEGRSKI